MLGDVINGVIGPIFDTTWSSLKAQYHEGLESTELKQERIKAERAIEQASENYHQRYLKRHCNIKILHMDKGSPLERIYTDVKLLDDSDLRYFSLDNLEELYRKSGDRRFRVGGNERHDGLATAKDEQYLMVLGGPGVGKSTFLRQLGLEALKNCLDHDLMPVFIELKSFKDEKLILRQAIVKELEISNFPYTNDLVESLLLEGKMLILLDGLDEVPSDQVDNVIDQVRDFCDQCSQNYFVASCRTAAYKGGFNRFTKVTIAEFDDEQIKKFIGRWFSSELDIELGIADDFRKLISQPENVSAKELAQTPLLLTFLCLVYGRSQSLPTVRSTLYEDALNIILKDWAAEKRIRHNPIYKGFHIDLEKELLSKIAYQSFKADQLFFSKQEITERITDFLGNTVSDSKYPDGSNVLEEIEVQQGILVERAANTYSFSHLTLQEYLAAQHISNQWLIDKLVSEHLTDERWREVFLLVSGLVRGRSPELLMAMEQQANVFISSLKLKGLVKWAANLSDKSLSSSQQLASRAWFLWSASVIASDSGIINAIAGAIANANAIAIASAINSGSGPGDGVAGDIASAIARARARSGDRDINSAINRAIDSIIDSDSAINYETLFKKLEELKEQIPSTESLPNEWQNFADELLETFLAFFHLDKELIAFTKADVEALAKHLYATKLIIDCKDAAVRVSRKEWEAIESRLLTVPGVGI